jgi:hypothetical protein
VPQGCCSSRLAGAAAVLLTTTLLQLTALGRQLWKATTVVREAEDTFRLLMMSVLRPQQLAPAVPLGSNSCSSTTTPPKIADQTQQLPKSPLFVMLC